MKKMRVAEGLIRLRTLPGKYGDLTVMVQASAPREEKAEGAKVLLEEEEVAAPAMQQAG